MHSLVHVHKFVTGCSAFKRTQVVSNAPSHPVKVKTHWGYLTHGEPFRHWLLSSSWMQILVALHHLICCCNHTLLSEPFLQWAGLFCSHNKDVTVLLSLFHRLHLLSEKWQEVHICDHLTLPALFLWPVSAYPSSPTNTTQHVIQPLQNILFCFSWKPFESGCNLNLKFDHTKTQRETSGCVTLNADHSYVWEYNKYHSNNEDRPFLSPALFVCFHFIFKDFLQRNCTLAQLQVCVEVFF